MDDATSDAWSAVARDWAELWGSFADPARRKILDLTGIRPGTRVLDVGCGSGEFLALLDRAGAVTAGVDPAPAMIARARSCAPAADIRLGSAESLPWPAASFDVVTAVNSLQFAEDTDAAVAEIARVTVPGGCIAIANWAEGERNDLDVIEAAVAASFGDEPTPDGDLRMPGGLERLLRDGGLAVVASGIVEVPWDAADPDQLVRGVLMGEDADGLAAGAGAVVDAAAPFRTADGGYRLANAFRYAVARTPQEPAARA